MLEASYYFKKKNKREREGQSLYSRFTFPIQLSLSQLYLLERTFLSVPEELATAVVPSSSVTTAGGSKLAASFKPNNPMIIKLTPINTSVYKDNFGKSALCE